MVICEYFDIAAMLYSQFCLMFLICKVIFTAWYQDENRNISLKCGRAHSQYQIASHDSINMYRHGQHKQAISQIAYIYVAQV